MAAEEDLGGGGAARSVLPALVRAGLLGLDEDRPLEPPFSRTRSYDVLRATYRPVGAGLKACPEPVRDAVLRVVDWGAPEGRSLDVRGKIGISHPLSEDVDGTDGFGTLILW